MREKRNQLDKEGRLSCVISEGELNELWQTLPSMSSSDGFHTPGTTVFSVSIGCGLDWDCSWFHFWNHMQNALTLEISWPQPTGTLGT